MNRFRLRQSFRYDYSGPVTGLVHRLTVVPPPSHGDQVRTGYGLEVGGADVRRSERTDRFGNVVFDVFADRVDDHVELGVVVEVERADRPIPAATPTRLGELRRPSALTGPDVALEAAARAVGGLGAGPLVTAHRVNAWVHDHMSYGYGVTGVRTTAAQALAGGRGVCQDYAHVMLALCRLRGVPCRYVSGHLRGEGGSHAWVEVITDEGAVAFDPTHGRRAGASYLTVAVGRDYADVAPTCGRYSGTAVGTLTTVKELTMEAVELVSP